MLEGYGKTDFYPFHMPGHKRREIPDGWEEKFPDPYSIDITEIDGFDNLHHPEGILKESMARAAEIYGADKTYYLVNGSTCGILSAICAATTTGGQILIARNCHRSAYHGLILNRLQPVYLYPKVLGEWGVPGGICPEDVEQALENGNIQAVFLVSPTYEGIVSDIKKIAGIAHEYGRPLIVDEAHGAHFPFGQGKEKDYSFPESALELGADIVIQSLHKTLPCFTQTAVLHCKSGLIDREKLERYLGMFQSSSPSYVFLAGMERCIRYMDGAGRKEMERYGRTMYNFFRKLENLKVLKVLTRSVKREESVFEWDQSKVVVSTAAAKDMDGERLGRILRDKYHLEMEMSGPEHIVAMTSLMDTEEGLLRLLTALLEIDSELEEKSKATQESFHGIADIQIPARMCLMPSEAFDRHGERIWLSESQGRISKEFVYLYPPGIPLLAPGEQITDLAVCRIEEYKAAGLPVQGLSDPSLSTILAVAEN